jgi:hypothetical protein
MVLWAVVALPIPLPLPLPRTHHQGETVVIRHVATTAAAETGVIAEIDIAGAGVTTEVEGAITIIVVDGPGIGKGMGGGTNLVETWSSQQPAIIEVAVGDVEKEGKA